MFIVMLITTAVGTSMGYWLGYQSARQIPRDRRNASTDRRTTSLSIHDRRQSLRSFKERRAHEDVVKAAI